MSATISSPSRLELAAEIRRLAQERNAIILAHNYQSAEVQDVAHHVGDSLGLSVLAQTAECEIIVFAGVHFMAESAKILSPEKTVLLPNLAAGCSLADSITAESLQEWKDRYPGHSVVTYVNSTAEVKALSDICCTSANAVSVVRSLDNNNILFTPDRNLGNWAARQVPEKNVVIYDGCCPIHDVGRGASVRKVQEAYPGSVLIAHPECRQDIVDMADAVCSTTGMLDAVGRFPDAKTVLIATENGILHQLKARYPDKEFVVADGCLGCRLNCPYMKVTTLEDIYDSLLETQHVITVPESVLAGARLSLERMLAVPRDH
jgi:quinolinate synthase